MQSQSQRRLNVYVGYDPRETLAYDVAKHSIVSRASEGVDIIPLKLEELGMLTRPIDKRDGKLWCPISQAPMATEFAISRFCVPFLQKDGWALFVDSDIVCLSDIKELFDLADDKYAVMVVKHNQETGGSVKMDGQVQTYYNRKNWSSVILWNCSHPSNANLTLEMLNGLPGRDLHRFCWLKDEEIGELPLSWNFLVDVSEPMDKVNLMHYTLGGAWFQNWIWKDSDWVWLNEYNKMVFLNEHPD